jgi:aryl-alcohol dehydrogenase-like predicted oxidoreductase
LFDTSDTYGNPKGTSEELLGRALRGRREAAVVATKFGGDMAGALGPDWGRRNSRRYIRRAVEASLRRLGTDWVGLYQLHWRDAGTPAEQNLATLDDLVHEGKVRYVGCCNLSGWEIAEAVHTAREHDLAPYVSAQNRYSLLARQAEQEVIPAAEHHGLSDPGFRRYQKLEDAPWDVIEALASFAEQRGHCLLELAFAGLLARPAVSSVIAGATSADQVKANAAAGSWALTAGEVAEIDRITGPASAARPPSGG